MAKMLLTVLSLGTMLLAAASKTECAVDGAKAVDQATDAAIFIWAATKRCGNPKDEAVKCAMDITSAATAVGNMANIIVAALDECDVIKTANKQCGELAGELTVAVAGLASKTAGMVDGCHHNKLEGHTQDNMAAVKLNRDLDLGECIIDAKSSLASIFDTVASLKQVAVGGDAEHNAFATVSAFASLGSAVAAAVDDCSAFSGAGHNENARCASETLGAVRELHSIADIAHAMATTCESSASRLYLENGKEKRKKNRAIANNSMSLALAAFLPVAAVLGFVFGRRLGKAPAHRDMQAMIQGEIE
jgi:hypothetical protein